LLASLVVAPAVIGQEAVDRGHVYSRAFEMHRAAEPA